MAQQSYFWVYIQRKWNQISKRYLHFPIHCNIIPNSQDTGQPKYPLMDEWIKEMWYYSIQKKKGNSTICDNMDEYGGYYFSRTLFYSRKWKSLNTER